MSEILNTPQSGTGLLAIFCDLDEPDRSDFRPWLGEDMFPARMTIGFNACASYDLIAGDGQQFVTLYEMPSLGHLYGEPYQALRRTRSPRDAAYHEKFRNPDRCTLAWAGPELSSAGGNIQSLAPLIQIDRFDLKEGDVQTFNIWFVTKYLPLIAQQAEAIRVRRYLSMEGSVAHMVLHEFTDLTHVGDDGFGNLGDLPTRCQSGRYQQMISS
ncbi:MAG: hypothetical protein HOJ90_06385 [Alphaproteobacteria bacterium]|jgi:hypothetical protein|nr:hypothetical protein [Alphaproteobacteria bacterium]